MVLSASSSCFTQLPPQFQDQARGRLLSVHRAPLGLGSQCEDAPLQAVFLGGQNFEDGLPSFLPQGLGKL